MDEVILKSGNYPNVAIPAGADPQEVKERYGRGSDEQENPWSYKPEDFKEFSGTIVFDNANPAMKNLEELLNDLQPSTLVIHMTRGGGKHIRDHIRGHYGGFDKVVIELDGERHEYEADTLIRLLEKYEVW